MSWTLSKIRARCTECGDCLLWPGGMMSGKYPIATEAVPGQPGQQRQIYVRRRVWELAKGKAAPPSPRFVLTTRCKSLRCVAPDHLVLMSKSKRLRQAVKEGAFQSVAYRAKVSAGRRRRSKLPDDAAAQIRASSEPGSVLAARHGISVGHACAIKAGTARRDYSSPFAALQPAPSRRA